MLNMPNIALVIMGELRRSDENAFQFDIDNLLYHFIFIILGRLGENKLNQINIVSLGE